jgi:hypothetical protein
MRTIRTLGRRLLHEEEISKKGKETKGKKESAP